MHKKLPLSVAIEDVAIVKQHKKFNTTNFYNKFIDCFNSNNHNFEDFNRIKSEWPESHPHNLDTPNLWKFHFHDIPLFLTRLFCFT